MSTALTYGTMVLFAATLVNRMLSFYNQIILMKYIGPETIGLFQMTYPVYVLLLVLATVGLPVALTKRVAEEATLGLWGNVRQMIVAATVALAINGTIVTCLALFLPKLLFPEVIVDIRAESAYWALIPSILFVCFSSVIRAFCQGLQSMEPPAIASFMEQVIRILSGISLALFLLPLGIAWAAVGIALGITIGELFGLISIMLLAGPHLFARLKFFWKNINMTSSLTLRRAFFSLWPLAYPTAISRIITCLMITVDSILIPRSLHNSGMSLSEATSAFGSFNGGAAPLITIPTVFTIPLSISLVPGIAESWALRQMNAVKYRTIKALRLTSMMGWPVIVIILLIGEEISLLMFGLKGLGPSLRILALGALFLYIHQTTTGILQGMGRVAFPLVVTIVASAIRSITFIYLASIPYFGLQGVALAYTLSNMITATFHLAWFRVNLGLQWKEIMVIFKPGAAAVLMATMFYISARLLQDTDHNSLTRIVIPVVTSVFTYVVSLPLLGCIKGNEIKTLPGGAWLLKILWKKQKNTPK